MLDSSKRGGKARRSYPSRPLSAPQVSRGQKAVRSAVESLESRLMLSATTYIVTGNGDDAGTLTNVDATTFDASTLRAAVTAANAGGSDSIIQFSAADFTGGAANTISLTANLELSNAGFTTTIDNTTGKAVVIDGGGAVTPFLVDTGVTSEIDNLTIQHGASTMVAVVNGGSDGGGILSLGALTLNSDTFIGNLAFGDPNSSGGAVCSAAGSLTINGGSFVGNSAAFGGGVYVFDQALDVTPAISNASFTSNSASIDGGAVENDSSFDSTFTLTNDTFTDNSSTAFSPVTSLSEPAGGTLTTDVIGCTFTGNKSGTGALFSGSEALDGSQPTLLNVTNSTFNNNTALGQEGGGIYSDDQSVVITGSTFTNNLATTGSGIYADGLGTTSLSITSSTFTGGQGTPVYDASTTDTDIVTACTFASNVGPDGGGIFAGGASLTAMSDVFTNNVASADGSGGGITFDGTTGTTLTINTIAGAPSTFTGNSASTGFGGAVFSSADNTDISDTTFTANSSGTEYGGAIFNEGDDNSAITLTKDTFTNNTAAAGDGGAVYDGGGLASTFTSTNTNYTGNSAQGGGAIFSNGTTGTGSSATITGATFSGNTATSDGTNDGGGGAIDAALDTLTLGTDTFTGNRSLNAPGGAVSADVQTLTVTASSFANDLADGNGGGIAFNGGAASISGASFTNEIAADAGNGGGLYAVAVDLALSQDQFTGDQAAQIGGGVYANVSDSNAVSLLINQSTFANDSATNDGGGLYITEPTFGASADIFNSTFSDDTTDFNLGGGIDSGVDVLTIANSTFNGDRAGSNVGAGNNVGGGGLAIDTNAASGAGGSTITVVDSTFSGNAAGLGLGGGISNTVPGNNVTLDGDIVAANTATGSSTANDLAGNFDAGSMSNLIGDGSTQTFIVNGTNGNIVGTHASPINPLLAPLANNGGPTQTMALLAGSPAFGAGAAFTVDDPSSNNVTAFDQRGVARPQSQGYDIGAYETLPADHFIFTSVPSSVVAGTSFTVGIEALTYLNTLDTSFGDTVSFTATGATTPALPANVTFVNGTYTLNTAFVTPSAGGYTITASDTATGTMVLPATTTPIVVTAPVAVTPTLKISGVTVTKTTSGTYPIKFPITLSSPALAGGVTIHYATVGGTASNGGNDYVGVTSATLTIPAGASSGTITITGKGNKEVYTSKMFTVVISSATGAHLGNTTATGTILSSNVVVSTPPAASINDITLTPANTGLTSYTFTVALSKPAGAGGVQITYRTVEGTTSSGAGAYVGISSATLHIAAGATSGQITIMVKPHTGPSKNFFVMLTAAVGATIADGTGMGTIL
ncbi:MAG TPA: choice-of-anchor Q domain-containing protein [Tepidisphaeraceae bacterium]|nr:choice-of-anchor Q domain-containing protein [Tepidisphaeraceae bacterium]